MNAVGYLRSSKDRAEVSLLSQRRDLEALAAQRNLNIVRWYEDAVQSGSTDDRPAFRELVAALNSRARGWNTLLVYDTSRIARGRHIAQAFRYECKRRGVELIIARVPETDPISAIIIESVFEAMDEIHSITSREKGMAGMRENLRQGWRAGGRAPWGYVLKHTPTGAVRDGRPVLKSRLEKSADADQVASYLKARARGVPRIQATRENGIRKVTTTLIDVDWNALVYAGHTVWNRHAEKKTRGQGKARRRDRSEWIVQRDTHPALITEAQAESILAQMASSDIGRKVSAAKSSSGEYLLSGLLTTSDGRPWLAAGEYYRLRPIHHKGGKWIRREMVERSLLAQVREHLRGEELVGWLLHDARRIVTDTDRAAPIRAEIDALRAKRERAAKLALESTDGEIYSRLVEELGREIASRTHEAAAVAAESAADEAVRGLSATDIREALLGLDSDKAIIRGLVRRVVLDPDLSGRVEYSLSMASPQGSGRWTAPAHVEPLRLIA